MKKWATVTGIVIAIIAAILAVEFLISAGLVWLVCWAFGWSWSWKMCVGIFAAMLIVSATVKAHQTNNNRSGG